VTFHQPPLTNCVRYGAFVRHGRLYFPTEGVGVVAQIIDAGAQTAEATAKAAAGTYLKAERAAKRDAQGRLLILESERAITGGALEAARIQAESLRAGGTAATAAAATRTKYIVAGAAGLGVLVLLGIVLLR